MVTKSIIRPVAESEPAAFDKRRAVKSGSHAAVAAATTTITQ